MPLMLSRILMLVVAVVLALPPGWCCFGRSGCCQASEKRERPESAKATQEAGDCCHCCQSASPQEDHTSPPIDGPCCGSNSKAKICSCVRPPVNKSDTGSHVFPDLPAVALAPVAHAPGSPCYTIALLTERHGADPPLNVLHCVWNC